MVRVLVNESESLQCMIIETQILPCSPLEGKIKHSRIKECSETIAVVTLQTFYLGKHDLLTVYLGKLDFLSVTDFSPGNLPRGNFIVWVLDMSRKQ